MNIDLILIIYGLKHQLHYQMNREIVLQVLMDQKNLQCQKMIHYQNQIVIQNLDVLHHQINLLYLVVDGSPGNNGEGAAGGDGGPGQDSEDEGESKTNSGKKTKHKNRKMAVEIVNL